MSECIEARRELNVECTAKAKSAEAGAGSRTLPAAPTSCHRAPSDLKVRLASLQRARDKMKEMDTAIETCNVQVRVFASESLRKRDAF